VADEISTEHPAMKQARRNGDADQAAKARARRDQLAAHLRTAATAIKDQGQFPAPAATAARARRYRNGHESRSRPQTGLATVVHSY
jgi:hypothetical protein